MISQPAKDVLEFWVEARGERLLPRHSDINLEGLASHLPGIIYSVRDADKSLKIKFAGSHFADALGEDITGYDHLSLVSPREREASNWALNLVGDFPCGMSSIVRLRGRKKVPWKYECLYLPVEKDGCNSHILQMVHPITLDYSPQTGGAIVQDLRYGDLTFVDLGAGTPPEEEWLIPAKTLSLREMEGTA